VNRKDEESNFQTEFFYVYLFLDEFISILILLRRMLGMRFKVNVNILLEGW